MKKIIPFNNVLTFDTDVYEITSISLEHEIKKEVDIISGYFYISGEYKMLNGGLSKEKFNFELPFDIAIDSRYDTNNMIVDIDDFRYELIDGNKMKVSIDLYIDGEELEVKKEKPDILKEARNQENIKEIEISNIEKEEEEPDELEISEVETTNVESEDLKSEEELLDDLIETNEDDIKREDDILKELIYEEEKGDEPQVEEITNEINNTNNNILNNLTEEENYVTYKVYRIIEGDTIDSILTKYKVTKEELFSYNDNLDSIKVGDKLIIPFK